MADQLSSPGWLPLDQTFAVAGWEGVTSFFREGWTGNVGDRVCVYHRPPASAVEPWVEVTTYVAGEWVDAAMVERMLADRVGTGSSPTASTQAILVDGVARQFALRVVGKAWSGLSLDLDPVVTVLAVGVETRVVALERVAVEEVEGYDRFRRT